VRQTKGPILAGLRSPRSSAGTLRAEPGAAPASAVHVAAHDFRMDGAVGGSTDDRRLLALAYLARLRVNGSSTSTMTGAFYATSKLVMMRNFWASTPAMPLPRPESSLPGRCPDSATNLRASTSPCTHSARTNGPKASLLPNEAAHSRAIHDSDQRPATAVPSTARWPEPAFPLMRAGRTALPIFQTGTPRQGVLCGSAPTPYSSQVQQRAPITAHHGGPLRTNERSLT